MSQRKEWSTQSRRDRSQGESKRRNDCNGSQGCIDIQQDKAGKAFHQRQVQSQGNIHQPDTRIKDAIPERKGIAWWGMKKMDKEEQTCKPLNVFRPRFQK